MDYVRDFFDPQHANGVRDTATGTESVAWGKEANRDVYVFAEKVTLAVNVALATGRPLLVAGEPGGGKSRLAKAVAHVKAWPYYHQTVTSRTQATDLLWTFDALRRLNDASNPKAKLQPQQYYVEPGSVWWGFDPASAKKRGTDALKDAKRRLADPGIATRSSVGTPGAVVLIDEIDKADPDVPNDLLEPFDLKRFTVKDTNQPITAQRNVFLMMTTNGERELPPAFLRRCILLVLDEPKEDWFELVASRHFPNGDVGLHKEMAAEVMRLRGDAYKKRLRKPSTAEFLDALRVCTGLKLRKGSRRWEDVVNSVLLKTERVTEAAQVKASADGQA